MAIVLTFDDAVSNHATLVAPLLRQYGFGATFYICEFEDFATNQRQYMTWEQIAGLDAQGFEVGNHTGHHACFNALDRASLLAELQYIEDRCREYGIPHPTTFAYPGCVTADWAFPVLRERGYRLARIGGDRPYRPAEDDQLLAPSYDIHGDDPATFHAALAQARDGQTVVLMFHGVPDHDHPWVSTPPARFAEYLAALQITGLPVLSMRELIK